MELTDSTDKNITPERLDGLFEAIGWKRRGKDKWLEVLSKSQFVFSVWDSERLVGFGRIMEDGVMCMFYDIGVHPEYQKKGIGKQIMNKLIDQVKDKKYASIGLFAWAKNPENIPFYEKFGFKQVKTGMELEKYMERE